MSRLRGGRLRDASSVHPLLAGHPLRRRSSDLPGAQRAMACEAIAAAPGSNTTAAQAAACAAALAGVSCQDRQRRRPPDPPRARLRTGALPTAPRVSPTVVRFGACHRGDNFFDCGVCSDLRELGELATATPAIQGWPATTPPSRAWSPPPRVACSVSSPCKSGLVCIDGSCLVPTEGRRPVPRSGAIPTRASSASRRTPVAVPHRGVRRSVRHDRQRRHRLRTGILRRE